MKIFSVCNTCFQTYSLITEQEYTALLKSLEELGGSLAKCPRLCGGKINIVPVEELKLPKNRMFKEPLELTVKELYAAIHGNGLPDEIPKDVLVVEAMLLSSKIKKVETDTIHSGIYLNSLTLENGVTIHLGGGIGPRVVKVTKEVPDGVQSSS